MRSAGRRLLKPAAVLAALLLGGLLALVPPLVTGEPGGPWRTDDVSSVPDYSGEPCVVINDNVPFFTEEEIRKAGTGTWFSYSELDDLDRAGAATACVDEDTVNTSEREELTQLHPSGWEQNAYPDLIEDNHGYVFHRGHLIMRYLGGSDEIENLITMTSACNLAMEEHEQKILRYVYRSDSRVLYRVTPVYRGDEKMARGVLLEAVSLDSPQAPDLRFCVYYYNAQPGILFDYMTGENRRSSDE